MASYSWIKLYHEVLHDPKMGRLSDNLWRRVIEVFLLAGENGGTGELPPLMDMAWTLRLSVEELEANLLELEKFNIVTSAPQGWIVTHYERRQAAIDTTERVRSYRERVKKHDYYDGETEESAACNEDETNRCTDTDKNKIKNKIREDQDQPDKPDGLNDLQRLVLSTFNAKRFANKTQAAIVASWDRYPLENVNAALTWAAGKGFGLGHAVTSLDAALPKWGAPKSGNGIKAQAVKAIDGHQSNALAALERFKARHADD